MVARKIGVASLLGLMCVVGGCASSKGGASAGAVGPNVVTMKVDGMACANCAQHIEHELRAVPGVRAASVSFEAKTASVTLDPEKPASREQLDAAVAAWRTEHFAAEEDPDCLDPKRREEIKRGL